MTDDRPERTRAEVAGWFFGDYLPRSVAAAGGAEKPEIIHGYWDIPMHVTGLDQSLWCLDDASVRAFLEFNDVFVCDGIPRQRPDRLPDGGPIMSSPPAPTLIFGAGEAVLVDPTFTRDQMQQVLLLAAQDVTEIGYQPAGDIRRELESFAAATASTRTRKDN